MKDKKLFIAIAVAGVIAMVFLVSIFRQSLRSSVYSTSPHPTPLSSCQPLTEDEIHDFVARIHHIDDEIADITAQVQSKNATIDRLTRDIATLNGLLEGTRDEGRRTSINSQIMYKNSEKAQLQTAVGSLNRQSSQLSRQKQQIQDILNNPSCNPQGIGPA
ncbi:MAG TPA: hypothetical protein VLG69_01770 [Candidatus Andersenbacteria bacterium]|nr:hypothetical protein [Candidatus Andersenbacteria bacterium]